jgi:hypothetical protein
LRQLQFALSSPAFSLIYAGTGTGPRRPPHEAAQADLWHQPTVFACLHTRRAGGWYGVFLRANTATGLSEHIASGLRSVVHAPAFSARLQEQAFEPLELDLAGFRQLVRDDRAFWEMTTRRLNLFQQE